VLAAMTSMSGGASACNRAARFGVSPTTPRSWAAPARVRETVHHGFPAAGRRRGYENPGRC
jgi:hypothetical protein